LTRLREEDLKIIMRKWLWVTRRIKYWACNRPAHL